MFFVFHLKILRKGAVINYFFFFGGGGGGIISKVRAQNFSPSQVNSPKNLPPTKMCAGEGGGNSIVFLLSFLTHSACQYDVT